jgi:hypothetical protein
MKKTLMAGIGRAASSTGLSILLVAGAASASPPETESGGEETLNRVAGGANTLPPLPAAVPPALRVLWFDPTLALAPPAIALAAQEVRTIFRDLGVEVAFATAAPEAVYGDGPEPEVPVILLKADPVPSRRKARVMGLVVRHQEPAHAVWAFLDNIRTTLGHDVRPGRPPSDRETREIALALGRVVAHEIIHAIAPEEPHSREGLMSHALDRKFLLGKGAPLDRRCASAFLTRLASRSAAPANIGSAAFRPRPTGS